MNLLAKLRTRMEFLRFRIGTVNDCISEYSRNNFLLRAVTLKAAKILMNTALKRPPAMFPLALNECLWRDDFRNMESFAELRISWINDVN